MHGSNAHKPATLFSLVLISVLVCGLAASARTPSPQGAYLGPGRYEIENFASGKVLDLNRQDQRTVVQSSRTHALSQQWDITDAGNGFVIIRSAASGLVVDIDGGESRNGARVITSQPVGTDSQLWRIEAHGPGVRFSSRLGKALDLPHGSHDDGVEYATWDKAGQDNQRFRLVFIGASVPASPNPYRADRDDRRDRDDRPDRDEKRAYVLGYRFGVEDYKARLHRTYARHVDQVSPQWQQAFIEGYYDGYDAARPDTSVMRSEEKDSYDDAFRLGQKDYREGREPNYTRYADRFDPRFEPFFRRGYADGYYSAR
ncbi:MAG TPA: RICIN domain-containing protein [Candidatus Acidoferrum sp.]|nr:RICIN domain-containing protein [Candidatus Acidoferrum sp.]